jgi:diguanylate cyclase (GGDEF)-like protein
MTSRGRARGELRERFYRSVAETLTLLHTAPGYDRRHAFAEVARILSSVMDLPLVWVGRRDPERAEVAVLAAAGPAAEYASSLRLSIDEAAPGGRGPVAIAMREGRVQATSVDAPEFAPWRVAARSYGFGSCMVAAAATRDGGQLTLAAYAGNDGPELGDELLDWAQRLVDELVRFWDHQALLERDIRMSHYRDAQRTIQRALLEQPDPEALCRTLAQALVDIAGAAAVDVHVADDDDSALLRRVVLAGPMAEAMRLLPVPPRRGNGLDVPTPTLAFMRGVPVVRDHLASRTEVNPTWHSGPLAQMGAIGCWPFFSTLKGELEGTRVPAGIFAVVTTEPDAFDAEMCGLLDEIADAAGLALHQHEQRHALVLEQERQTYLALHDDLTGLPNRRALDHYLEGALLRAGRSKQLVAVGLLDLDDLKPINDRYGHATGDRVLVELATRLCDSLRTADYVARLGGDEFVLVLEGLDHAEDLDVLLERVGQALQQPLVIDAATFRLSASLGVALFPLHAQASGEQLLRRADVAMYQVKARKRHRLHWWSLPLPEGATALVDERAGRGVAPYGEAATELLTACRKAWQDELPMLVERWYAGMQSHEGIAQLLDALPASDAGIIKQRLAQHLQVLLRPDLDAAGHRVSAVHAGVFSAACGIEEVWLLELVELLRDLLAGVLGGSSHGDQQSLGVVLQRLGLERQWQLESMRELQRRRVALLARLNTLAWSAAGYLELIQGVVDLLVEHEEIVACAVGRPDASGQLTYEAVGGAAFADYLRALACGKALPILVNPDSPQGRGSSGRAWQTATIQRCAHYGSDPAMASWRDIALNLGIVSNVAVPLCPQPQTPVAVLTLYSPYAGGLHSEDQRAFVEQIKTVLDLALARLAPPRPGTALLPFVVRERWRALIATDAVQMHYQPVVRFADGVVAELEALARLRDGDGALLLPGGFLPALGDGELVQLFEQALAQAMTCRQVLARAGYPLDMSINAPAAALQDARYLVAATAALASNVCPASVLLLEILESPMDAEHSAPLAKAGMQAFKTLGFRLVEDDLGAGYSSLIRLRQWPFDRVKIDQAIVLQVADDPLRTLRFIRQLIRLGHDLGLEVVVEGLETPGLIEAAMILGADLGQGYAFARPLPPAALPDWLAQFNPGWDAEHPVTALGTLASALLGEEQFVALPADPLFWMRYAQASGDYARPLGPDEIVDSALDDSRVAMHAASIDGPLDPTYRRAREKYFDALIRHVVVEERRGADSE